MERFIFGDALMPLHKVFKEAMVCRDDRAYMSCKPEDLAHYKSLNHLAPQDSGYMYGMIGSDHRFMAFTLSDYIKDEWLKTDYYKAFGGIINVSLKQVRVSEDFAVVGVSYLNGIGRKNLFKVSLEDCEMLKNSIKTQPLGTVIEFNCEKSS